MAMRTISLKLNKPSTRKRQIIEEAMLNYSRAYQFLLDRAHGQIKEIKEKYKDARGNYRALTLSKWIDKDLSKELNKYAIEPFKDSLKIDFGMTMAGFLSLQAVQEDVGYPLAYLSDWEWEKRCNSIINGIENCLKSVESYEKQTEKLASKMDILKPLFFCRYAVNRDYSLLYDEKNNRYYAKLYLMNVKSHERKPLSACSDVQLRYIYKDFRYLENNAGRPERYILVPLSFGKWQEGYLKMALENPEILKTARLVKKGSEYFLSVNIDIAEAQKVNTVTYLGVARGLKNPVHYTVIGNKDNIRGDAVFESEAVGGRTLDTLSINEIHSMANKIVAIAVKNKSRVIMESFVDKGDKLQWADEENVWNNPVLSYHSYNKLFNILCYKLDAMGLPSPVKVSPVGIFYTCPQCGLHARKNRFSKDLFICLGCGLTMDIEALGSLNVARKLIKYSNGILKVKIEKTAVGVRFINKDLGLDFSPANPFDCLEEFTQEIKAIIKKFYADLESNQKDNSFKKKYSIIKKIEEEMDFSKLIQMV